MSATPDDIIEAAGGVLWRLEGDDLILAVIHRPKYDDWSLPKGKLDLGESHEEAAVREVYEETGWLPELGTELGEVHYEHNARPKRVRYWAMRAIHGVFTPNSEVDDLRWMPVDTARDELTYRYDRDVLERFLASDDVG